MREKFILFVLKTLFHLFLFLNAHAFAKSGPVAISLKSDIKSFDVDGRSLEVFKNDGEKLTIEDILKIKRPFKKYPNKVLGFGFSKSSIWIKLPIKNKSTIKDWVLSISFPDIDEITFYKKKNGQWVQSYGGDSISNKKWDYLYKDYIFNLDGEDEYYLKIKNKNDDGWFSGGFPAYKAGGGQAQIKKELIAPKDTVIQKNKPILAESSNDVPKTRIFKKVFDLFKRKKSQGIKDKSPSPNYKKLQKNSWYYC